MADKFISITPSGQMQEKSSTTTSAGAGDSGRIPALDPDGKLDVSMMPASVGLDTKVAQASENLSSGDFVNFWEETGTLKVRKADGSDPTKAAHGYVIDAYLSGENATVFLRGVNSQVSGISKGDRVYLSDVNPGEPTTTPVTTTGHILQFLGTAVDDNQVNFDEFDPIIRA